MWNKWKQICDKHNEKVTYVNEDDYWDHTEAPIRIGMLVFFVALMFSLAVIFK
jgi:hypothetical protein